MREDKREKSDSAATKSRAASDAEHRNRKAPATFSGDLGGGGTSVGVDLGRGGTTTPIGDLAGGGEPGSLVDFGEGTVTDRDAVPTGGAGTSVDTRGTSAPGAQRPEALRDLPRSATEMAPGIPSGSGEGIDNALEQPDSEIGGGVAGDTTPVGDRKGERRNAQEVKTEDKDRTTL